MHHTQTTTCRPRLIAAVGCLLLPSTWAWAQVDASRLQTLPQAPAVESLYILDDPEPPAVDSVCEVIGELPTRDVVGRVMEAAGDVQVERLGRRLPRSRRDVIMDDDRILTGPDAHVLIRFNDSSLLSLTGDSEIHLYAFWYERSAVVASDDDCAAIELRAGKVRLLAGDIAARNPQRYEILVPGTGRTRRISVRGGAGADLEVTVMPESGAITAAVYSGGITVASDRQQLELGSSRQFVAARMDADGSIAGLPAIP